MNKILLSITILATASLAMAQGPRHHAHPHGSKMPVGHVQHHGKPGITPHRPGAKPQMPQHGKPGIAPHRPGAKPQPPHHGKPGITPHRPGAKPQPPHHGKPGITPHRPGAKPQMPQHGKPGIAPQRPGAKPWQPNPAHNNKYAPNSSDVAKSSLNKRHPGDGPSNGFEKDIQNTQDVGPGDDQVQFSKDFWANHPELKQ